MNASLLPAAEDAAIAQPPPAVQLAAVEKSYGTFRRRVALSGVTLRIARGECYGLAGPNGAGKTTLIKVLLGVVAPDAGEARLFGCRPELPDVRRRVGFVPEAADMPHGATPLELVQRWARLRGLPARPAREEGERHLVRLGMKELLRRPAHRLSKGERQRTLLSLALLGSPDLLVLDEPTDGLDPLGRALMRRVIEEECAAGRTVFLNSHLLSETERLCSRVGILHRGRLVREESLADRRTLTDEEGTTAIRLQSPLAVSDSAELGLRALGSDARYAFEHRELGELNTAIDRLRARGALIVEVQRVQVSIEQTLAEVASEAPQIATPSEDVVVEEAPALRVSRIRGLRAVLRVARELLSDLAARRILHVGFAGALLLLALIMYVSHDEFVAGLAASGRLLKQSSDTSTVQSAMTWLGRGVAMGAHWVLLIGSAFLAALFAPPLLNPRRSLLLQAQPLSRGDIATGIFASVCLLSLALFVFFDGVLFAELRWLGAPVPGTFLLVPLITGLAFSVLYAGTLTATYLFPNALFAGLFGLGQLILFSVLNSLDSDQLGKSKGLAGFVLGFLPRLVDLGFAAGHAGGGSRLQLFPILSGVAYTLALLLMLQVVARRSEQ